MGGGGGREEWRGPAYIQLAELGDVEGEELEGDDGEDALQAVYAVRHRDELLRLSLRLLVTGVADQDRFPLKNTHVHMHATN